MTAPAHPQPILIDATKVRNWLFERAEMHQDRNEWDSSFEDLYLVTSLFRGDFSCASHSSVQSRDQVLDEVIAFLKSKQSLSPLTDIYYGAAIKEIDTELRRRI